MWGQRPFVADVTALGGERAGSRQAWPPSLLDREGLESRLCCRVHEGQAGPRTMFSGLLKHKALWVSCLSWPPAFVPRQNWPSALQSSDFCFGPLEFWLQCPTIRKHCLPPFLRWEH